MAVEAAARMASLSGERAIMMLAYNQCFPERQVKGAVFPLIERKPR
jgi:hypothetical protein